ncbi:tetratricopeptide repeat protein [Vibrio cyclitrophicus]|uniref:tetratricopeptide repeat protein n=1 Tax=Vibrio cyclitrophicus TaxID=47951 RepID=UPI0003776165|nr:tetratricopeptide repeat protein [Vibrio cyclitrophicus]OCH45373.1 anaphase-promoting protein [Vibrio cyclitrophicus]OEE27532.1 anaphase-promoting protein [Vibrio cyclitrophicus ZF170]PME95400.1 anaphase-promoting protein [Vibrio cyclitrophicus]PMF59004.1 anaphase-promoting protein [Vibrio cyclitrophicus]PMF59866.1 anaphase-promoting protein [Vibrio cyclitrophicus]
MSVLAGCQSAPSPQDLQLADVTSMEKVKNYDGLISYYKSELEQGSEDPKVKEKLAWAYFHKGDIESADFYVQHLQKEGVENPNLYQLEGQVFDAKNDVERAIAAYLASIDAGNTTGQIRVLLGVSYTKVGRFNEAYQELNQARLRGYDDVVVKNNIAMIQMANGDYQHAIETLAPVLKEDPANKIVKANLAIALMKTDQIESAVKLLKGDFSAEEIQSIAAELTQLGINDEAS